MKNPLSLRESLILSITIVLLVIGVHQSITNGFAKSYWIFMLMLIFQILFQIVRNKTAPVEQEILKEKVIPTSSNSKNRKKPTLKKRK